MKVQGIIGTVILAAGGMCPLIHVFLAGNWNYFGIDLFLAIIFYVIVALALLASWLGRPGFIRIMGWAAILMMIFTLTAVWFKTHNYFSFLHFKNLVSLASGMVSYKWGWLVILAGATTLITVKKQPLTT
jgi:hypothetical protein